MDAYYIYNNHKWNNYIVINMTKVEVYFLTLLLTRWKINVMEVAPMLINSEDTFIFVIVIPLWLSPWY